MPAMIITVTPAMARPCSAGAHSRSHSKRRNSSTGTSGRSRPFSASRPRCSTPTPTTAIDKDLSAGRLPVGMLLPAASEFGSKIKTSLAWGGEQDEKVSPAPNGVHGSVSRPSSAASLTRYRLQSAPQGDVQIARRRCTTKGSMLGADETYFLPAWDDVARANEPSYMRHTRASLISRGHSLASFYNAHMQHDKNIYLCHSRNRSSTPASGTTKIGKAPNDWEVDKKQACESVSASVAFVQDFHTSPKEVCQNVSWADDLGQDNGLAEDRSTEASPHLPGCWCVRPSIASWLLHPTPTQRLAPAVEHLPSSSHLARNREQAPDGSTLALLSWYMQPSVGTWFIRPSAIKRNQKLRTASGPVPRSYISFTSLSLRPLPSWFHLPPHPPARFSRSAILGPPPLLTCSRGANCKTTNEKWRARQGYVTDSSRHHLCQSHVRRFLAPAHTKATQLRHKPPACNAPKVALFESWRSMQEVHGRPVLEDSHMQWHDVALTLVARTQASTTVSPIVASTASAFVCRPSVGTWCQKPMPGPVQINALTSVATRSNDHQPPRQSCGLALHFATRDGNQSAVQMLLTVNVRPDVTDEQGIAPLHLAAEGGHNEIVRLLLDAHADPHIGTSGCSPDTQGITALHAAACCGCVSVTMRLLIAGASPSKARGDGILPLHFAAQGGHVNVALVLLAAGSPLHGGAAGGFTPLHDSAHGGHLNVVAVLLAARADTNAATDNGATPLHGAAQEGHSDVSKCLLVNGAAHAAASAGGFTPLHDAAHAGHKAIVKQLIHARASPNVRSAEGATPLHLAAQTGRTNVAIFLAKKCAGCGNEAQDGSTVLLASPRMLAASRGHVSIIRALRGWRRGQGSSIPCNPKPGVEIMEEADI